MATNLTCGDETCLEMNASRPRVGLREFDLAHDAVCVGHRNEPSRPGRGAEGGFGVCTCVAQVAFRICHIREDLLGHGLGCTLGRHSTSSDSLLQPRASGAVLPAQPCRLAKTHKPPGLADAVASFAKEDEGLVQLGFGCHVVALRQTQRAKSIHACRACSTAAFTSRKGQCLPKPALALGEVGAHQPEAAQRAGQALGALDVWLVDQPAQRQPQVCVVAIELVQAEHGRRAKQVGLD